MGCAGPEHPNSSLCPSLGARRLAAKGGWRGIKHVASQHMQAKSERSPGSAASSRACAESWLLEPASPASACPHLHALVPCQVSSPPAAWRG